MARTSSGFDPGLPHRWVRAGASAVAGMLLGLAGHALAGGVASPGGALLAFLAVLFPSWLLAGRECSWAVIAGVQFAAQQVVHPLLVAASDKPDPAGLPPDLMFSMHVFGAIGIATWLRLGERRVWTAARRLSGWVRCVLAGPPPQALAAQARRRPGHAHDGGTGLLPALSRRGPPLPA